MIIISFFSNNGVPATGLSPTIDVWELDATHTVNAQSMTEIAGGFYYYDFSTYDLTKDYCIRADGTATLDNADRYVYSTNETAAVGDIQKYLANKWVIDETAHTMTFYDDNGTTPLKVFNLKDQNDDPSVINIFKREPV